jgi:hypothetical protein
MPSEQDVRALETWDLVAEDAWEGDHDNPRLEAKERDWSYLQGELRDFRKKYGLGAMLRCVADSAEGE